jgi:hypothetical protein
MARRLFAEDACKLKVLFSRLFGMHRPNIFVAPQPHASSMQRGEWLFFYCVIALTPRRTLGYCRCSSVSSPYAMSLACLPLRV